MAFTPLQTASVQIGPIGAWADTFGRFAQWWILVDKVEVF